MTTVTALYRDMLGDGFIPAHVVKLAKGHIYDLTLLDPTPEIETAISDLKAFVLEHAEQDDGDTPDHV